MKQIFFLIISFLFFVFLGFSQPQRVILFGIDGLHWEAPQLLEMPVLNELIKQGTYIQQSYVIIPHHPTIGDYSKSNSCSFPNPVLHQGTIFLSPDNKMIQELFSPQQQTAFVVNTTSYRSIGRGFSTLIMDDTLTDAQVVDCAINILKTQTPIFMRVHLQRPGQRGYDISQCTPDKPYYGNIFGPLSPYVEAIEDADKQLGRFVTFLKESDMWDNTVLIVTSDHGQSRIGWHPLFDEDSWMTPLVFIGYGIGKGKKMNYFEHSDLAPTIAGILGKKWPISDKQAGIFVKDILIEKDTIIRPPRSYIKVINSQIREYNLLKAKFTLLSEVDRRFANLAALLENQTFIEPFYHQDRILNWHEAGTIDHLIKANDNVLKIMRDKFTE